MGFRETLRNPAIRGAAGVASGGTSEAYYAGDAIEQSNRDGTGLAGAAGIYTGGLVKGTGEGLMFQNVGPRPQDPRFMGITGAGGKLDPRFSAQGQGLGEFQQRLRQQALGGVQGPSQSAQLALQSQQEGQLRQRGSLAQQIASQRAQAVSGLASRGGVSSGARERLASQGARQGALQQQTLGAQGAQARQGILGRDLASQQQRLQGLEGGFASQEENRMQQDLQARIGEQQQRNQFNLGRYQANIKEWGAAKEAAQQEKLAATTGGLFGSGGALGTGLKF